MDASTGEQRPVPAHPDAAVRLERSGPAWPCRLGRHVARLPRQPLTSAGCRHHPTAPTRRRRMGGRGRRGLVLTLTSREIPLLE